MSSHAHPTEQQLKPLLETNSAMWSFFVKAATIGVIGVILVVSLALFIITRSSAV